LFSLKRQVICSLLLTSLVLAAAAIATQAQKGSSVVRRVSFQRGRTTSVQHGSVRHGVSHDYLLRARAGQTMSVHLTADSDVNFSILSPGGNSVADFVSDWSGELQESGDYRINVLPPTRNGNPARYTLEITIR
jgi:hypothetical protein